MKEPIINKDKCNNCGTCTEICPIGYFEKKGGEVIVVKPEQECLECEACVQNCEKNAIKLKVKK